MKILVTGASGFIGGYVVREAIARRHDVIALTRSRPASETDQTSSFEWLQCDLGDMKASKLERLGIDAVIHLAASLSGSADEQYRSTVIATRHLLDAMKQAGISRLVGISSIAVLDYAHIPAMAVIDENVKISDGSGIGTYTKMKLEQEKLFAAFADEHGTRCAVLRPGLVYDSEQLINARAGVIKGPLCLVAYHGGNVPTVEVAGLARAILNACERDVPDGEIIQLVDDNLPSQREYLAGLRRRGTLPSWRIPVPWRLLAAMAGSLRVLFRLAGGEEGRLPEAFLRQGFAARFKPFRYSNEKAKRLLGWVPASRFS
ncbi:NAD-dependent epimerase/dehydratase family protein [Sulfuricaulis sp.]|jgi:nucleoside-diphosphate-sugar epimerase|uniref:NAD-dependent epimerase/dehydratase family protein n=1 Tax=Sulfuricaulis sp. TaxID=2003553 RepID=UPI00355A60C8